MNIEFEDFHEDYFYKEDFYDYENEYNETIEDHKNVSHNVEERQTTPEKVGIVIYYIVLYLRIINKNCKIKTSFVNPEGAEDLASTTFIYFMI